MAAVWRLWRHALLALVVAGARLSDLLVATAQGHSSLQLALDRPDLPAAWQSAVDDFGFGVLAVAAYNGDARSAELLLSRGAKVPKGQLTIFKGQAPVQVSSVVELVVRRSAMLIMLGTGFNMPSYLHEAQKKISTARAPSEAAPEVPDMGRALALLIRAGAEASEKSQEEGSDLARAAYFLDSAVVDVLVQTGVRRRAASRALIAALLGISQLKHRLNRALLQQPRMAGRLFRDFYGFDIESEAELLSPSFQSMSFQDTLRMVNGKALQVVRGLLQARADPSFAQSRQSGKTPLHHCAEHGLTDLAEELLAARANLDSKSKAMQRTPLHQAVVHRSLGVVKALLSAGASATAVDAAGRAPPELANLLGWTQVQLPNLFACEDECPKQGSRLLVHELLPKGWQLHWDSGNMAETAWNNCEIQVMDVKDMTADLFVKDFLSLRRPLLVRGGAKHMPALERWNLRYLVRKAGDTLMSAVTIPYPEDFGDADAKDAIDLTLKEYVERVMGKVNSSSGTPLYVFSVVEQDDPKFHKLLSLVQKDVAPHPHWLQQEHDQPRYRFGNIQFGLGPRGSGAPQHYHTHAYASLFSGRKSWLFYPPPKSALSRQHAIQALHEDRQRRKQLPPVQTTHDALMLKSELPLFCEQVPGDIMYVPTDWGHMTFNEETSVSISREFSWDAEESDSHVINSLQL
ncbi:unnamed protein product [Effrenium voratum]|uniref:JmjC domain-containing protein n=1 Tax=Effrenium voratum TaxID=2562239 RepID=A0AA36JGD9_9DINO|nr:unnamed protein product [Effrenium voratum]CAJ1417649.1 unnamed protein product [Effrenium voratum]